MYTCRDGVIDKGELKLLLQSTDGGLQRVTKHPVRGRAGANSACSSEPTPVLTPDLPLCLQDWLTDEDVSKWLIKYDWDSSGDISFNEFQALVRFIYWQH